VPFTDLYATQPAQAFWFGILSAVSLPLGAVLGIWIKPPKLVVSGIMAFGAGSLLAALTLELVTPAFQRSGFPPLALGALAGGGLFVVLNRLVNSRGGFLRKPATALRHLVRSEKSKMRSRIRHLAAVDILQGAPMEEIRNLMGYMVRRKFKPGALIYNREDVADSFFLIDSGQVLVHRPGELDITLVAGDSFGTRSFFSERRERCATVKAKTAVKAWEILQEDFERLVNDYPVIMDNLKRLNEQREYCSLMLKQAAAEPEKEHLWRDLPVQVSMGDVDEAAKRAGSAAVAIWLGIFLDGVPESAVIGASMVHESVSWALIIGLFLANLPESMSSAVVLRRQQAPVFKIMTMWSSLTVITGVGALLGNLYFQGAPPHAFAAFEGLAAGAMLVMVAETMLPEAYQQGGPIVGMCTLLGFLAALLVKSVA
jgi:zinc transporter ZupT